MKTILLAASLLLASRAGATFYTGDALLEQCRGDSEEAQDRCRGYISGVDVTIAAFGRWNLMRNHWCAPEGTTLDELKSIVVKYLAARPAELHVRAAPHVVDALMQAFPCE